jgi:uncharacterized membrane protein
MTALYGWLLLVHILAAMVWVGGVAVLTVLVARTLADAEPQATARFVRNLRVVGPSILAPAPILVLGLGLWLVAENRTWDLGQLWLQIALGLFAAAFLVGVAFQSRAGILADRAVARNDHESLCTHLRRWSWGSRLILALLVAATWAMVLKPGL